jgi:phosphatidylserine/phosphatidylglycerophosphate/cardiolipin synthase-like enzyme
MTPRALLDLSDLSLQALAASFGDGPMRRGIQTSIVQSIAGATTREVLGALQSLEQKGFTPPQLALLLDLLVAERVRHPRPEALIELVLSGPEVESVPMQDTAAVMQTLVCGAESEILLVGYAIHDGRKIFRDVADRMHAVPALQVTLCINIPRGSDSSAAPFVVERFAQDFRHRHWPGDRLPALYYLPASLERNVGSRASLHAKCVVVDRARALVTSANFTEAAQSRNLEIGILVQHAPIAARIVDYIAGLRAKSQLATLDAGT